CSVQAATYARYPGSSVKKAFAIVVTLEERCLLVFRADSFIVSASFTQVQAIVVVTPLLQTFRMAALVSVEVGGDACLGAGLPMSGNIIQVAAHGTVF